MLRLGRSDAGRTDRFAALLTAFAVLSRSKKVGNLQPDIECRAPSSDEEVVEGSWRYFQYPPVPDGYVVPLVYPAVVQEELFVMGTTNEVARLDPLGGAWNYQGSLNLPSVDPGAWAASPDFVLFQGGNGNQAESGPREIVFTTRASILDLST